jgi:hypothetical protein
MAKAVHQITGRSKGRGKRSVEREKEEKGGWRRRTQANRMEREREGERREKEAEGSSRTRTEGERRRGRGGRGRRRREREGHTIGVQDSVAHPRNQTHVTQILLRSENINTCFPGKKIHRKKKTANSQELEVFFPSSEVQQIIEQNSENH